MLVGYEGKIIDGRPSLVEAVTLPENAKIFIMVEITKEISTNTKINEKEIANRRAMVQSLKGILAGHDIDLEKEREERRAKRGYYD